MPLNCTPVVVLLRLVIEIVVEQHGLAAAYVQIWHHFHLDDVVEKCSDTLWVVGDRSFAGVVGESAVTVRRPAEARAADRFYEIEIAVLPHEKLLLNPCPC